jgi:hypothetical protein
MNTNLEIFNQLFFERKIQILSYSKHKSNIFKRFYEQQTGEYILVSFYFLKIFLVYVQYFSHILNDFLIALLYRPFG